MAETTSTAAASVSSSNTVTASSSLLMAIVEEVSDLLLHGTEGASSDPPVVFGHEGNKPYVGMPKILL